MKTARLCGHTFVKDWISASSIVVDFGMNRGEFSGEMIHRFGCRVWGAEPDPRLFREIPDHPGLTKLPIAIGGSDGHAAIHLNSTVCSSLLFAENANQTGHELVEVPLVSLRTFLEKNHLRSIHLLKMDIEGAEIDMFDACDDKLLLGIEQITVEFHQFMNPRLIPEVRRITNRLQLLGFFGMDFSRDRYDVLFVNTNLRPLPPWSKLGLVLAKYGRGVSRVARSLAGRGEPPSWTVADELRS